MNGRSLYIYNFDIIWLRCLEKQRMSIQYGGVWFELPDSRWSHALCRWVHAIWPRKGCNAMVMVLPKNNRIQFTRVYIPLASYVNLVELGHLLSGICTQSTASCNWSIDMLRITTIMCFFCLRQRLFDICLLRICFANVVYIIYGACFCVYVVR